MASCSRVLVGVMLVCGFTVAGWMVGLAAWFFKVGEGGGTGSGIAPPIYFLPALVGMLLGFFLAAKIPSNPKD